MGEEELMFIGRRQDGSIYGTWTCPQPHDAHHPNIEDVPDNHPDVVAFQNRPITDTKAALRMAVDQATNLAELKEVLKQFIGT